MKTILLFVPDLMFGSRIEDVARQLGYKAESIDAGADIYVAIQQSKPALVVTTFDRNGDYWEQVITAVSCREHQGAGIWQPCECRRVQTCASWVQSRS